MIRDVLALRSRLQVASLSLLTAAGCAPPSAPQVAPVAVTKQVAPVADTKQVAPVAADPPKPEQPPTTPETAPPTPPEAEPRIAQYPRATCPTHTWSNTVDEANKRASDGERRLDCPIQIHALPRAPGQTGPTDGFPGSAYLDDDATRALGAGHCSYTWTTPCPGGRPLLTDDGPRVADIVPDAAWLAELAPADPLPAPLRAAIADAWLQDARSEHASIASFARATLELLALAAPPALVAASQKASLEEIDHAQRCFALASHYAGAPLGPGPLHAVPIRDADLVRLACDTFVEGCVGETIAALIATRAARRCADTTVAATLTKIADDEAEHAALAWATVAWAITRGGEDVRAAVRALAGRLHAEVVAAAAPPAHPSAAVLAHHGRLDAAAEHACRVEAWQHLIGGALEELCACPTPDAHAPA
ncbi:ferritin-like domain-containing protein [Nannocystis bainbridge]|uniref:Ferritin-like domain-containing protein n=1 Tax=Nannocystis bainbridge TaxID=2995303 RepID=A0ABT5E6Q5_9BACT|nr:ferritin-like domain-containing protein [Nannocystis bainbridge]MDC0721544.1 ferritin-like domain-containing protein [Nannocystis bainbridge]